MFIVLILYYTKPKFFTFVVLNKFQFNSQKDYGPPDSLKKISNNDIKTFGNHNRSVISIPITDVQSEKC
ncbi:MAG: hypothetical protein CL609_06200 [Anaerolineaceae bacterium]|nr:hypothetical protein [Anaerolineaceae bacterium]